MGKASRTKGARMELATVALLKEHHLEARKVPLSGATWMKGDIHVDVHWRDEPLKLECKIRADGFKELYRWLEGNDVLVIRADRQKALAVIPLELLAQLIQ